MKNKNSRLKIGFITSGDVKDKRSWSGSLYSMAKALNKHCGEVIYLGPAIFILEKIYEKFYYKFSLLRKYNYKHGIILSKIYAKYFNRKISIQPLDVIFAPAGSTEIAFLKTKVPIIYFSDATFALMINYYPLFSNLLSISKYEGNLLEKRAIDKADLILYSSNWAKQSAINDYSADKSKIHVLPFGANIDEIPLEEEIYKKKKTDICKLLFLGVDWERKGGEIAFEAFLELEKYGVKTELVICGCIPPDKFTHKRMKVIPFLDKNDRNQSEKLNNLLLNSNFLILPTQKECSGIVLCEANAFGLPIITTNVGGISDVIENGKNGFMLPVNAGSVEYAKIIYEIFMDEDRYNQMIRSSRAVFNEKLNWDVWGAQVNNLISDLLLRQENK